MNVKDFLMPVLAAVFVSGVSSTSFAAANPFRDVPIDHWAYDAVYQLAKDGVIEGYGDQTYRGEQEITRYEMAQIIAKAMTKEDISKADKSLVDKLAAEFSDELNNLGVRVTNLEKKTDNVKWTGEIRYTYASERHDGHSDWAAANDNKTRKNTNEILFRLEPTAQINEHWRARARIDYAADMNSSKNVTGGNSGDFVLDRAYVEGTYGNTVIDLGKIPYISIADRGMLMDDVLSGAQVTFGSEVKATITAGRFNLENNGDMMYGIDGLGNTASYQGIEVNYAKEGSKLRAGVGYHHLGLRDWQSAMTDYHAESANLWTVGFGYQFTPSFAMNAAYAKNTAGEYDGKYLKDYTIELDYKGADPANKGSFGVWTAYRYLGSQMSVMHTTYDAVNVGQKGWEFGVNYTFAPNIMGTVLYFNGKDIDTQSDRDASKLWARMEFFF